MLLLLNAPIRPRTPDEDTPRELAARYKQKEVVELLEWASQNYPKPRTKTSDWLHKESDRAVSTDPLLVIIWSGGKASLLLTEE